MNACLTLGLVDESGLLISSVARFTMSRGGEEPLGDTPFSPVESRLLNKAVVVVVLVLLLLTPFNLRSDTLLLLLFWGSVKPGKGEKKSTKWVENSPNPTVTVEVCSEFTMGC